MGLNSSGCGGEARLVTSIKGREPPLPSWAIAKTPCLQSMEYTVRLSVSLCLSDPGPGAFSEEEGGKGIWSGGQNWG